MNKYEKMWYSAKESWINYILERKEKRKMSYYDEREVQELPWPLNRFKTGCQFLQPPTYPEHNVGP
jgi:hypothetical protein